MLFKSIFRCSNIYNFKVNSKLKLCDSLVFGTTSPENNKNVTTHHIQIIGHNNKHNVTVHYDITGLHPLTNFTFIVYINDTLNNTKDEDQTIFSEFTLLDNRTTILFSQ